MAHAERRPDAEQIRSGYRVAVVGASGAVGRMMLHVLEEREFPAGDIVAFGTERSAGTRLSFRGEALEVQELTLDNYQGFDLALFSAGSEASRVWTPRFAADGCWVVDNSSQWRMHPDVPLIVPEVNAHDLDRHFLIAQARSIGKEVERRDGVPWCVVEVEDRVTLLLDDAAREFVQMSERS